MRRTGLAIMVFFAACALVLAQPRISGVVSDGNRPVAGAVVRLQATDVSARTNERGEFTLDLSGKFTWPYAKVTAWASGYYIAGPFFLSQGQSDVRITLKAHHQTDDPSYEWVSALSAAGQPGNCQNCHSNPAAPQAMLPFDEWALDAHGTSARNRRFLSMYNGTDLSAEHTSPLTGYAFHKDYGKIPLPPDPSRPYYGPGFKLDFPDSAGNCAACHLPAAAVRGPYDTDPNAVRGVGQEGVACDLCHKAWAVKLNPATGLPYPNTPGVLSFEFRRPSAGHQLFLGPYDDVAPGDDSLSPLQNDSRICAPCHFATFWGVQVYNSFGEWLASPYSDPVKGQSCQDCHMPRRGTNFAARSDAGANVRDPKTVFSHLMPGAADRGLLQKTAALAVEARQSGPLVHVKVTVTNDKAGHHIPTDHPSRNILLVVSAKAGNRDLIPYNGPVIPAWGGAGTAPEDYAGRPGRGYAKILEELWTEVAPTAAYWNPTVLRADTRIAALAQDVSEYDFLAPAGGGTVQVEARLLFRRAFRQLSLWKQWSDPDILMNQSAASVAASDAGIAPLAFVHAATLRGGAPLAPDSIATVYGAGLSGARVAVRDRYGAEADARLLYVSPGQINLVLPPGLAPGAAVLKVTKDGQPAGAAGVVLAPVAPGIFTASGKETGPAAAMVVTVAADGSQTISPAFTCRAAGDCSTAAISIEPGVARYYLMLFGTGIRGVGSSAGVKVSVGGIEVPVLTAGAQSQFDGLDQVNVELLPSLAAKGEVPVRLSADGLTANTVFINVR